MLWFSNISVNIRGINDLINYMPEKYPYIKNIEIDGMATQYQKERQDKRIEIEMELIET